MQGRPADHRLSRFRRPRRPLSINDSNFRLWLLMACLWVGFVGYGINGLRNGWAGSVAALAVSSAIAGMFVAYLVRPREPQPKIRQSRRRRAE
jgi:hypothetical protein